MLSLQEIQSVVFEKAVFGGYDSKSVDDFIEKIIETFATMQKENMALKSKMKVLVDKIDEYRSVEDGMRKALLSAQNIADEMISSAKTESEELISKTKADSEELMSKTKAESEELIQKTKAESESLIASSKKESENMLSKARYETEEIERNTKIVTDQKIAELKEILKEENSRAQELQNKTQDFISNIMALYKKELDEISYIGNKILDKPATIKLSAETFIPRQIEAVQINDIENIKEIEKIKEPENNRDIDNIVNSILPKELKHSESNDKSDLLEKKIFEINLPNKKVEEKPTYSNLQFGKDFTVDN